MSIFCGLVNFLPCTGSHDSPGKCQWHCSRSQLCIGKMQWKEKCLRLIAFGRFCSMFFLICQLKQNVNKFVTCSNFWRQNTTLLLIFPVREIRYYPSIECMISDILSRLNIIEHQFTRIMLKTWKSELASHSFLQLHWVASCFHRGLCCLRLLFQWPSNALVT